MAQHPFSEPGLVLDRSSAFAKPDTRPPSRVEMMITELRQDGHLTDQEWVDALREVPRHMFAPDRTRRRLPEGGSGHVIDKQEDLLGWMAAIYSGDVIVTQVDEGAGDLASGEGQVTSTLSRVTSVVNMLQHLHPYDGDRVLEIGTGVGYTTGLLCHRLGSGNVTSIEIDEGLVKQATVNLAHLGYAPHLIAADGAHGCPEDAPYDRVHVTCGVARIPYAWVEQTRPGGLIVLPWMAGWIGGHTVTLTVQQDRTAIGRFLDSTGYMLMRSQRPRPAIPASLNGHVTTTEASVDPRRIVWAGWGADVAIAGLLPDVSGSYDLDDQRFRLLAWSADSQVTVTCAPDRPRPLVQRHGPRDLWQEIQQAFFTWVAAGMPDRDRFGVTITHDGGMRIWLDQPDRVLTPSTSSHAATSRAGEADVQ